MELIRRKKPLPLVLTIFCLLLLLLPVTAAAEEDEKYFTLSVSTAQETVLAPCRVPYTEGQTVLEALEQSEYDFRFQGTDKTFVETIEGVSGNFVRFHDYVRNGNDYNLEIPAENISLLVFTETEGQHSENFCSLILRMREYTEMTNHVQNYPQAQAAYEKALEGIRTATGEQADSLLESLNAAIAEYEALLSGPKQTVSFTVTQGEEPAENAVICITDAYGNQTESSSGSMDAIAGTYTFEVSDGGYNCTRGSFTVAAEPVSLSVELPSGNWFDEVRLSRLELSSAYENGLYNREIKNKNEATYSIPDCTTLLYLNATKSADAPKKATLRTIYQKTSGKDASEIPRNWNSYSCSMSDCLSYGMEGRTVTLEARLETENGYLQVQRYVMRLERFPTLSSLTATADGTAQILSPSFDDATREYSVRTTAESLLVAAEGYSGDYEIKGAGTVETAENPEISITVSAEGKENTYTLSVLHTDPARVTLSVPDGCKAEIQNAEESTIPPSEDGTYALIPGDSYTVVSTKDSYYHASFVFQAEDGQNLTAATPKTDDAVTDAAFYNNYTVASGVKFETNQPFDSALHTYQVVVSDTISSVYVQATADDSSVRALYDGVVGENRRIVPQDVEISESVGNTYGKILVNLLSVGGESRTMTLRASQTEEEITYYQDYCFTFVRSIHLKTGKLSLAVDDETLPLKDPNDKNTTFIASQTEYRAEVLNSAESLVLTASFAASGDYQAEIGGKSYSSLDGVSIPLDPQKEQEDLQILVSYNDENAISTTYTFRLIKKEPVAITFSVTPEDATVFLKNNNTGRYAYPDENHTVLLAPGASYTYTVTKNGYIGEQVTDFTVPKAAATIKVDLEEAPTRTYAKQDEVWPTFRADASNNGVVDAKTPTSSENAVLYWATKLGEGYGADACGCPILVGDSLYTYAKDKIYRLNVVTGEIEAEGKMDHSSSFAINSPTYAEGMIFVGLANGCVQAFDAQTLTSLWLYTDPLGGQPNCPIAYYNGYVYTGFWQGEQKTANYVCLSVTDENPSNEKEEKLATWQYSVKGGFYWAGAYVTENYILVPTDDGESGYTTGYAKLLSLNPRTGELLSSVSLPHPGDARSSITYSEGRAYFTTKGGYFYSVAVSSKGVLSDLHFIQLYNYASDEKNPAMSTCSPVIYNGRAYIGVSGTGQFQAYSGHNITVIDLNARKIAYTVRTQGYPQTSGLLTTAYAEGDGTVYVYFFDNYTPGKLRVLRDKPGQTEPDLTTTETAILNGESTEFVTPSVLFTPTGDQAQYAICSPITDASGTLYFKNDSAYMMAVGSTITKLRVDTLPKKTTYCVGESFDADGMKITAVYSNGYERDVTDYVTYSEEPLTTANTSFEIRFEHILYSDSENPASVPTVTLTLKISTPNLGDVNADGRITAEDAAQVAVHVRSAAKGSGFTLSSEQTGRADVDEDGEVTMEDAEQILQYSRGSITAFSKKTSS